MRFKALRGSPKGKAQRGRYLLVVDMGRYSLLHIFNSIHRSCRWRSFVEHAFPTISPCRRVSLWRTTSFILDCFWVPLCEVFKYWCIIDQPPQSFVGVFQQPCFLVCPISYLLCFLNQFLIIFLLFFPSPIFPLCLHSSFKDFDDFLFFLTVAFGW